MVRPLPQRDGQFVANERRGSRRRQFQAIANLVEGHVLLDVLREADRVRLRACAERFRQKRTRNDPPPSFLETSRVEGTATLQDAASAPELPIILWESNTVTLSSSFLKQMMERAALRSAATKV